MSGTYAPQVTRLRPLSSAEKVASNDLYTNAQSELLRFAETKKTIDEAQKFVAKDAQGATPAEIKTFVSKDPNLTPLQSASFELVTKPEFRNATAQEKTDKVLNEYLKQGGELPLEFLAKVRTAFKTDVEKIDLGGGLTAITFLMSLPFIQVIVVFFVAADLASASCLALSSASAFALVSAISLAMISASALALASAIALASAKTLCASACAFASASAFALLAFSKIK